MPKPTLGPVKVGDRLLVIPGRYSSISRAPIAAVVTKAGRVWIDLEEVDQVPSMKQRWRMRTDTQDGGSGYSDVDRFVTAEQWETEQRVDAATSYLRKVRALPESGPWAREPDRLLALANFLRQYDGLDPL